jgi:hypothetical protein
MNRKRQIGGPASALALLVALAACTVVGHRRAEGWPQLKVTEHHVANSVMRDKCARYVGFGVSPIACSEFNLVAATCDIWLSADFPPPQTVVEHERLHCAGYDHIGGNTMTQAVRALRAGG